MQHPFIREEYKAHPSFTDAQLTVNDYLLIVQPHEDLYNKIVQMKKSFAEKYDNPMAMYLKPHLTMLRFMQYAMQEQKIIQQLQHITQSKAPFKVDLNGFGSFPTHTIYVNVQTKNHLVELGKSLKAAQHLMKFDKEHKAHFITEPHISIARKLLPWQYEKAWLEYSNTPFTASFMVHELVLLRRRAETKGYSIAAKFPLLSKAVQTTTQASLFS
jgi:2'-5' RNA ligase